jgi:mannosyltransferase
LTSRTALVLGGLVVLGLLLRLAAYDDALFGDELSTYFLVRGHGLHHMIGLIHSDQEQTPPLFFVLAWLSAKLGGGGQTLRLPSMTAGLAAIPLVYALGARTVGRAAGLLAAALLALSPFLIFYSTEARGYAALMLLALTSTYALVSALQTRRPAWWAVYAIASCAAMYTHYTGVFLLAGQALWAFATHREAWRPLVIANGAAAIAYLPWINGYREDSRSPATHIIDIIHPFTAHAAIGDVGHVALGAPFVHLGSLPGPWGLALIAAGLALAAVSALGRGRPRQSNELVLVLVCAAAVPVGAGIASVVGPSVYLPRNLITAAPYLALAAGALLTSAPRVARTVAAALVVAGFAVGAAKSLQAANQRPDYNAAADFIARNSRPGDPIAEIAFTPFAAPAILQSLEVALADKGLSATHPVMRVGLPTVAADRRRREPPGPGQFAPIPTPDPAAQARMAAALARGGTLFVAPPGGADPAVLRSLPDNPQSVFLGALPRGLRLVGAHRFPGIAGGAPVLVYRWGA